jgi:hypothetical protein
MVIEGPDSPLAVGAPAAPAGFLRRHRVKLVLIGLVAVGALAMAGYTAAVLSFSYSTGDRVGFVQKLSKKGWICRTWEGELAMSPVPGAAPQLFLFSIRDDNVAKQITALEGKRVSLQYEEKKGIPTSCFGETSHFVTAVRAVGGR